MAKKDKKGFRCSECNYVAPRWAGQCVQCQAWNTLVEFDRGPSKKRTRDAAVKRLGDVQDDHARRIVSGWGEFDRTVGGGLVPGGVTLLGGDPGVGKSTLLLQLLARLASPHPDEKRAARTVLYVTGEESAAQVAMRGRRLHEAGAEDVHILATVDLEATFRALRELKPDVCVIDSAQTIGIASLNTVRGSVSQLREVTARLVDYAKVENTAMFIIGHVTKDGHLAGPKVLEHLVDTVLAFEGERSAAFRLLRTTKNRFGATHEVGVFEMVEAGLRQVPDPSAFFLSERSDSSAAGSVVVPTAEGSRPLLVELQALVTSAAYGSPRRVVSGVDSNRLSILLAVLDRRAGYHILDRDVFASVAGGARSDERAVDLGLALAVLSSFKNKALAQDVAVFGELGLAGEVRAVPRAAQRVKEAEKLGFKRIILPQRNLKDIETKATLHGVQDLEAAIDAAFDG